jgi:hypothetical protein
MDFFDGSPGMVLGRMNQTRPTASFRPLADSVDARLMWKGEELTTARSRLPNGEASSQWGVQQAHAPMPLLVSIRVSRVPHLDFGKESISFVPGFWITTLPQLAQVASSVPIQLSVRG